MIRTSDQTGKTPIPSDPATVNEFDMALTSVAAKYRMGSPLTRRELVRLVNASLRLIERGGK